MKQLKFTIVFLLALTLLSVKVNAQQWNTYGNSVGSTDFLGTTNTQPLELKTTNTTTPQPINFYTNDTLHMFLTPRGHLDLTNIDKTSAYMIGGNNVLQFYKGNPNNLLVGTANVTITKKIFATNFVVHAANQPDIDLQEKITALENEIALLKQQMTALQATLTAKN